MNTAKVALTIGSLEFSGDGQQDWVAKQLDKILAAAPSLLSVAPTKPSTNGTHTESHDGRDNTVATTVALARFLQDHNATANQIRKFLATAVWLSGRGTARPTVADVTKALRENQQPRIGNPSDALNKNVAKGHCEKDGKSFFVTPDGRKAIG